jgi:hypothetical protein
VKGLSEETARVFESIKTLDVLNDYLLIGLTALSMRIEHRLCEYLDFCKWQDDPSLKKKEVDWPDIESKLRKFGNVITDVLDLHHIVF